MTGVAAATGLSRGSGGGRPAAPVRLVHLGLGNFFRAHQAFYTEFAHDADDWGFAAFTGRRPDLSDAMAAQDGLYTLATLGPEGASFDVIGSVSAAYAGTDSERWLEHLRSPQTAVVTITATEAAYMRGPDGGLAVDQPAVRADVDALRSGSLEHVTTVPGRLVAGLAARFAGGDAPLAIVPCDNLSDNGTVVARMVGELAEQVDPRLAEQIAASVSYVTSMVDRITPRATASDLALVTDRTGRVDRCPVITEPFTEWVLAGDFPAGRPRWQDAGAEFVSDVTPFERRKLWLLNGAHSLLAYAGSIRGHETVAEAIGDPWCRSWTEQWWDDAVRHLDQSPDTLDRYREALLSRFENPSIRHLLAQIAMDGSEKLAVRTLPVLQRERREGRLPLGATRTLAAWVLHLRGLGAPVNDPQAETVVELAAGRLAEGVRRSLGFLDPDLAEDTAVVSTVIAQADELVRV